MALKDLLGSIEMEAVQGECVVECGKLIQSRPYYVAHSRIQTLALLDKETKGSNWLSEEEGFEPPVGYRRQLFSRQPH